MYVTHKKGDFDKNFEQQKPTKTYFGLPENATRIEALDRI